MAEKSGIVKANTKAYGYSYTSLSDIVSQDYKLPKMKTGTDANGKDYIFYYDEDIKDWIRGAEIIVPEMKGMNAAQKYGAGVSFARRYTAMMCLSLASSDDEKLESKEPEQTKPRNTSGIWDEPIQKQENPIQEKPKENLQSLKILADQFRNIVPQPSQEKIFADLHIKKAEDLGTINLQWYIEQYGQKQASSSQGNQRSN